uniref:Uncharacterized protein n=1 Tax=Chenopodium quinoa TaxID=63459 RepID=A0A803NA64_CHEQI
MERLGCGLLASEGFQQSLKLTSKGLVLCFDYSVMAFRDSINVREYLSEHFHSWKFDYANGPNTFCKHWKKIVKALVGLKVRVTHRSDKSIYAVKGLTDESARDISFTVGTPDGEQPTRQISLLEYFRERYSKAVIEHENLPCLKFGKGKRVNYVPIELCKLVEGQRFPKDDLSDLDKQADRKLKGMSVLSPEKRKSKINGMVEQKHGLLEGEIRINFGIYVTTSMTTVEFGVMEPPKLKLRNLDGYVRAIDVDKEKCQWNLVINLVVEGTSLKHWAVVVFNYPDSPKEVDLVMLFVQNLIRRCNTLGLHMEDPVCTIWASMDELESTDSVTRVLEQVQREAHETNESNLQLVLCVMAHKHTGYRNIKWVSETKIGINAKLGGSTVEPNDQPSLFDEAADHVMLIGANVNHPPPSDSSSKSVVVVASMNWPAANKYIPRISYQKNRLEEIKMFGSICLELIKCYENINRFKPNKLVIFRDGVCEGQFDMVLNKELLDLKDELRKIDNYHPTITLIVAQKRHLTRLFRAAHGDDENNIRPGMVVDTDIVHPSQFDFYLCSHCGSMGTSKPTHYHVLWDDHKFSPEKLQQFIYHLCFTFAKCSKPVSLVPPIYYADRLAFRGRLYCDAQRPLGESPSNRNPAHSDIKNFMYFI